MNSKNDIKERPEVELNDSSKLELNRLRELIDAYYLSFISEFNTMINNLTDGEVEVLEIIAADAKRSRKSKLVV